MKFAKSMMLTTTLLTSFVAASGSVALAAEPYPYCSLLTPSQEGAPQTNLPGSAPMPGAQPAPAASPAVENKAPNSSGSPDERAKAIPRLEDLLKETTDAGVIVDRILTAATDMSPKRLEEIYASVYALIAQKYIEPSRIVHLPQYEHKYDGKLKTPRDLGAAINDLVTSVGDRWTYYHDPAEELSKAIGQTGKTTHFGAFLRLEADGSFVVEAIMPGSSAQANGIREGDTIVSINNTPLAGMTKDAAEKLEQRSDGDQLHIVSIQDGQTVEGDYTLRMPGEDAFAPKADLLENNLAYIKLPSFMAPKVYEELTNALLGLQQKTPGGLQGIILDLRYNGGGRVDMAKDLIAMLTRDGLVLHEREREGHFVLDKSTTIMPIDIERSNYKPEALPVFDALKQLPLVILVNGSSASASEIVAGSLQEARPDTTVLGEQSFGKGVEMIMLPLPNCGQLAITSGAYTTPSGVWLHGIGVTPDVVVHQVRGSRDDTQLAAAVTLLKEETVANGANVAQRKHDDTTVLGTPTERTKPQPVSTWTQFWERNSTLVWRCLAGAAMAMLLLVYLGLARKNRRR